MKIEGVLVPAVGRQYRDRHGKVWRIVSIMTHRGQRVITGARWESPTTHRTRQYRDGGYYFGPHRPDGWDLVEELPLENPDETQE